MIVETVNEFAEEILRPAAHDADAAATYPVDLIAKAAELGITSLNIPEDFDGIAEHRSTVTNALVAEALAYGDMGLALPILAPAGVASALTHWGSAEQQATYLPEFAGENVPQACLAIAEPHALFDPTALKTTAVRTPSGYRLDGVKSLVPAAADAELFIIAAQLNGKPALFIVEASSEGVTVEADPRMGIRGAALGRVELDNVAVPLHNRLGEDDGTDADFAQDYSEAIALSRLGWAALAVGTSHAVLDYVIPYVKEREAFGEPIARRQAVAFMCANIAIELDGLRLITWRGAARAEQGLPFAREAALAKRLAHRQGHADRPRRCAAARRPRLHQGTPGRALVPRSAGPRRRRGCRRPLTSSVSAEPGTENPVMAINLEMPKKLQAVIERAHQGAAEMLRPISRKYDLAEHAYPVELDTLANCSRASRRPTPSPSPAPTPSAAQRRRPEGNVNGANMSALSERARDQLG